MNCSLCLSTPNKCTTSILNLFTESAILYFFTLGRSSVDWMIVEVQTLKICTTFFALHICCIRIPVDFVLFCKKFMFLESILMKPINQNWQKQRASASHFIWRPYWFISLLLSVGLICREYHVSSCWSEWLNYTEISLFEDHPTIACTIANQNHESPKMWLSNSTVLTLSSEKGWNALEIRSSAR